VSKIGKAAKGAGLGVLKASIWLSDSIDKSRIDDIDEEIKELQEKIKELQKEREGLVSGLIKD